VPPSSMPITMKLLCCSLLQKSLKCGKVEGRINTACYELKSCYYYALAYRYHKCQLAASSTRPKVELRYWYNRLLIKIYNQRQISPNFMCVWQPCLSHCQGVHLSVRLSICPSHSAIVPKRCIAKPSPLASVLSTLCLEKSNPAIEMSNLNEPE